MPNEYFYKILLETPNFDWYDAWKDETPNHWPRWKSYTHETNSRKWHDFDQESSLWPKEIMQTFHTVDIKPATVRVFKWQPKRLFPWHTDGSDKHITYSATNWVVEGKGTVEFNKNIELPEDVDGLTSGKKIGTINDEVLASTFGHQYLLDTSLPHRVNNIFHNEPRTTVSIVWKTLDDRPILFEDLKNRFDKLGLIDH